MINQLDAKKDGICRRSLFKNATMLAGAFISATAIPNCLFAQTKVPQEDAKYLKPRAGVSYPVSINVEDFGAVHNGSSDDTLAIQAAIDYALQNQIAKVILPQGKYKISNTIQLGYGYSFVTIILEGIAGPIGADDIYMSTLLPTFLDRPVINIQGVRYGGIENVRITGPVQIGEFTGRGPIARTKSSNYIPAGAQTYQNAPYCGVCIDGFSGSKPTNHYPLLPIPSFLGHGSTISYGRLASSGAFVRNCGIRDTYIGVMVKPNDSANGDFVDLEGSRVDYQSIGVSLGSINCRSTNFSNMNFNTVHTCFSNQSNFVSGTRGNSGGTYDNIHCNIVYRVFNIDSNWGSPWVVTNLYCEGTHQLGKWDSFGGVGPCFIGCDIRLTNQFDQSGSGIGEAYVEEIAGPAVFIGCKIEGQQAALIFSEAQFEGCKFLPYAFGPNSAYAVGTSEATGARRWLGVMSRPNYGNALQGPAANLPRFRHCSSAVGRTVYDCYDTGKFHCWHSIGAYTQGTTPEYPIQYRVGQWTRGHLFVGLPTVTISGRSISFKASWSATAGDTMLVLVGPQLKNTWFCCESCTPNGGNFAHSWTAYNNYAFAGNTYTLLDTEDYDTRPVYYFPSTVFFNPQIDALVTTKGSPLVQYVDETGAAKAIPSSTIAPGRNVFWYGSNALKHLKTYLPFPPDTKVSSVGSTSFVMSNAAQISGVFPMAPGICESIANR